MEHSSCPADAAFGTKRAAAWLLVGGAMRVGFSALGFEGDVPEIASTTLQASEMVEGWELWHRGWSPYAFGACKSPPLLMAMGFALRKKWIRCLAGSLGDAATACQLSRQGAVAYWVNPICALACAVGSLQSWASAATLFACSLSIRENFFLAGLCFAATAYAEPANLSPCLTLVACHRTTRRLLYGLVLGSSIFASLSALVSNDWMTSEYVREPTLGVGWYLNVVLFDRFLPYFNTVLHWHTFVYALPIGLRLHETPLLAAHCSLAVVNVFKSDPTFVDAALNVSLAILHFGHQKNQDEKRAAAVVAFSLAAALPLATRRVARHLWIVTGRANANHVYFQDVIYTAASSVLLKFGLEEAVTQRKLVAVSAKAEIGRGGSERIDQTAKNKQS